MVLSAWHFHMNGWNVNESLRLKGTQTISSEIALFTIIHNFKLSKCDLFYGRIC